MDGLIHINDAAAIVLKQTDISLLTLLYRHVCSPNTISLLTIRLTGLSRIRSSRMFRTRPMRYQTLIDAISLRHATPIAHIERQNGLTGHGLFARFGRRPDHGPSILRGVYLGIGALEDEGKVEEIFDRLRKGFGIKEGFDSTDFTQSLAFGFWHVIVVILFLRRLKRLTTFFLQDFFNNMNVLFDRRQFVTILVLFLDIFWFFFWFFRIAIDSTGPTFRLFALLGSVLGIEGTSEETNVGGEGIETNSYFGTQFLPVKSAVTVTIARETLFQFHGETERIVARDLMMV
jgi:hypothetical protein